MTKQRINELTKDTRVHLGLVILVVMATFWFGSDRATLVSGMSRIDQSIQDVKARMDRIERRLDQSEVKHNGSR